MNSLDKQYQELLLTILEHGVDKEDRTGTGTRSIFGYTIRHNMQEGFPAITTKKLAFKTMVTELLWFLKGDTNIKYLVDNGCNIWNGDAYKRFDTNQTKLAELTKGTTDIYTLTESQFIDRIKTDNKFAKKWGELGPIYGAQWRSWGRKNVTNYDLKDVKGSDQPKVLEAFKNGEDVTKHGVKIEYQDNSIDQIQNLINELKTNPDSRRLMVNAWNVGELDQMVLPPCHYGFQVYTRILSDKERYDIWFNNNYETGMERHFDPNNLPDFDNDYYEQTPTRAISLMWNQRSVDTFLGLPFNIASYGLLLTMLADEVNMIPDQLIGNLGDVHLYSNHIEQAKEQIGREGYPLPQVQIQDGIYSNIPSDIKLVNYQSHPTIKAPLSN